MLLRLNQDYQAKAILKGLAVIVPNSVIKIKLEEFGFVNVIVEGKSKERIAKGTWAKPTQEIALPKEVTDIQRI